MFRILPAVLIAIVLMLSFTAAIGQRKMNPASVKATPADSSSYRRQLANKDFFQRMTQFSELSWATGPYGELGSEKTSYLLSADIQPHFFIGGERMRIAISVTPRYKVRMFWNDKEFGDSSLPVRTPSFMPGATVYIPIKLGKPDVYKDIRYVSVAYFHHSNGQDHSTYASPGVFNYYNGDFSTHFFELAFNWNDRTGLDTTGREIKCGPQQGDCDQCQQQYYRGYSDLIYKIGVEQHFQTALAQRGSYGRTRINGRVGFIKVKNWRWRVRQSARENWTQIGNCYLKESYRLLLNFSFNVDKLESPYNKADRRLNIDAGIFKRIAAGNTAVFGMIGYYGNDPYNIYYSKNYFFIRAGIALGFFVHTSKLRD